VARQTFYFSDGPYLQAMHGLHAAVSGTEAFVKFIGQGHTGKSGVCEKLAQFMRHKDYRVIYFDYAIESPDMLRSMIAKELAIPDTSNILRHLEDSLASIADKPLLIIFDDAHQLSDITLIEIYKLAGVQVEQNRVINIVLCGEPDLEKRLSSKKEFRPLLQHVSHNFLLEPMDAETTSHFLTAFLEKTNLPGLQLEPGAKSQFYKSCKGFPGPAYSLCQLILSLRHHDIDLRPVTKEELLKAIRSIDGEEPVSSSQSRQGNRWLLLGPIVAVIVIASLALLMRQLNSGGPENAEEGVIGSIENSPARQGTPSASPSPFAEDEDVAPEQQAAESAMTSPLAGSDLDNERIVVTETDTTLEVHLQAAANAAEEIPVFDSNLALVTVQERGIAQETITEPEFEPMVTDQPRFSVLNDALRVTESAPLANIVVTRPMLALDDDDEVIAAEAVIKPEPLPNVAEADPAPAEAMVTDSRQMVENWIDAWQGQNLDEYFASYDAGFVPRYHRNKEAWRSNRERVIGSASQITLELSDFMIVSEDEESIEVHFWLAYRSPSYRDDTRKKLILKKLPATNQSAEKLLILEEINLEVRA